VASVSMSRRTIALVLAVALAALATIALISYIKGLEDKHLEGTEPVEVFVAKQDIPAGVTGDTASQQGLIERFQVPGRVQPEGAITSLQEISGRVAAVQIFQGEIIVSQRFVTPGAAVKGVLPIPEGRQAISVQVATPPGVAGFIQPGDRISLIIHIARPGNTAATSGPIARYLLQNIDVLAVGTRIVGAGLAPGTAGDAAAAPADTGCCLLTVALTPGQAEQLVFAINNGQLYFTLLPEKAPNANTPGRTITNLFN
jgi:pilus assembly protein CpaB